MIQRADYLRGIVTSKMIKVRGLVEMMKTLWEKKVVL